MCGIIHCSIDAESGQSVNTHGSIPLAIPGYSLRETFLQCVVPRYTKLSFI